MTPSRAAVATALHARTRFVDAETDPFHALGPDGAAWWHDNAGFATAGTAARVDVDEVAGLLAGISVDDEVGEPGTGAIAVGTLPFATGARLEWTVPARVTGRTPDGRTWVTTIGAVPHLDPVTHSDPSEVRVRRVQDHPAWTAMVRRALAAIAAGTVEKVVLAREVSVEADAPFDRSAVIGRLRATEPGCFVFASGPLVGASPELLVRRRGATVCSRPMAGTVPAVDGAALERLTRSAKLAHEHRLVIDAIARVLTDECESPPAIAGPRPEPIGELAHLVTEIRGRLPDGGLAPSALDLARRLHPTPAVGGTPTAAALQLIEALEPAGRGLYAGAVGWVDAAGDGELAVSLRSAQVHGTTARLHAGAGIVAGSDADEEWAETEVKLLPMLRALVRP